MQKLLVGDIGGTKTTLALHQMHQGQTECIKQETFSSHDFDQLPDVIKYFLSDIPDSGPHVIALSLAGPVIDQQCHTTNLPWTIDAHSLQDQFSANHVLLLNDIEAAAIGLQEADTKSLLQLNPSVKPLTGHKAIVSIGTGLGEAYLFWDGQKHIPSAAEGGHEDFAPSCEQDIALWHYLKKLYPEHISYERVVSGPGLVVLYQFLSEQNGSASRLPRDNAAAWITQQALSQSDKLCVETLDYFVRLLAKEAANLCLKVMARGGLYLTGGIAPKIAPLLKNQTFLEHFVEKGRFKTLLLNVPVWLCLDENLPLSGALIKAKTL